MISEILELRRLLKNQRLSSDALTELQNRKLRAVIRLAYGSVPYYRSLFSSLGLTPDDIRTVEDLEHIPITTKDDLRAAGVERIVAEGIELSSCTLVRTSGSTGKPFATYFTRVEGRTRQLLQFRALLSVGFHPWDRLAVLGPEQPHQTRLHQRLGFYQSGNISPFHSIENQIQRLQVLRPTIFWAYPTMLRALLHRVDYSLSKFIRPRILITSSEIFDDEIRRRILADLDIDMFNFYGANEVGRIASECAAHEGLHVNADHVILECVENEWTVEMGKAGVTVITSLNAFTMPLIRYNLGDICKFVEKTCSCGSSFPLIEPPLGRSDDLIRLPNGMVLAPNGLFFILRSFNGIDQFRIIQESLDRFVLQIVFRENPQNETLSKIRSRIIEFLDEPVRLDIQVVDFIQDEKLKFRAFISNLPKSDF